MIYRSSSLLSKNDNASYSVVEMARTPETYIECLLQLNEEFQEAENEYNIAYYKALKESALNESTDLALSEGLVSKAVDMLSKLIESIINFIRKFVNMIRGKGFKIMAEEADKAQTEAQKSVSYEEFLKKTQELRFYHVIDWSSISSNMIYQACGELASAIESLLNGNDYGEVDESVFKMRYLALYRSIKKVIKSPSYSSTVTDPNSFKQFVMTDVVRDEIRNTTGNDFINYYTNIKIKGLKSEKDIAIYTDDETKRLESFKVKLETRAPALKPENVTKASKLIHYYQIIIESWTWFLGQNFNQQIKAIKYYTAVLNSLSNAKHESSTIHGELFTSDTLFANDDPRDFNRTEWLDLELTTEVFCFSQAVNEARRSMAVQEAIIWSENAIPSDTFRKLQTMQEIEMNKLGNAISEIINRVKEFITKFINDIQDKHGPTAAFLKRNGELIRKNPIKLGDATSSGNIIKGIYRIKTDKNPPAFNPTIMNEEDKLDMFEKHFMAIFSDARNGKRPVMWDRGNGVSISDFCKAYYGASMSAEAYPPVKYTAAELEKDKGAILEFMTNPHASIFSKIKKDLADLEKEAKKAGAEGATPGASTTTQSNNNTNNAEAGTKQESMFYSVLYDRWFNEVDIANDPEQKTATDTNNSTDNKDDAKATKNCSKTYIDILKDILLSKLTAARFIYSECNQILRAHAKSYMSKEQAAAEAKNEKGAAGNNQNAQQKQQPAEGEQQTNS